MAQRIRERGRAGGVGVGEDCQQLVAADAPEGVGLAGPQAEPERDLAEDGVAGCDGRAGG